MTDPTSVKKYKLTEIHRQDAYHDLSKHIIGKTGTFRNDPHVPAGAFPPNFISVWFLPDDEYLTPMYFKAARFEEVK